MPAGPIASAREAEDVGRDKRLFARGAVWATHMFASVLLLLFVWLFSAPVGDYLLVLAIALFTGGYALWWSATVVVILGAAAWRRTLPARSDVLHAGVAPLLVLVVVALHVTDAPLRARFELSRPAMDDLVRDVLSGTPGATGDRRVGLFQAGLIGRADGGVRFATGSAILCEAGFASLPARPRDHAGTTYRHLTGPWYLWAESECD